MNHNFNHLLKPFEAYSSEYFKKLKDEINPHLKPFGAQLIEAIEYSFFSGGKRFRPLLGLCLAKELDDFDLNLLYPWLLSIEMIHTYSLIHDDLPALDNDDFRRSKPSNHKMFGEAMAILAGDCLSSEAFKVIATYYSDQPHLACNLVFLLSRHIGIEGMVLGQVTDIISKKTSLGLDQTLFMHQYKTGALIQATLSGTAKIMNLKKELEDLVEQLGINIGLSFQIKDDLLDSSEQKIEQGSIISLIGLEQTQSLLVKLYHEIQVILKHLKIKPTSDFYHLIEFNMNRHK